MEKNNIPTPKSLFIRSKENIDKFCQTCKTELGFPLIIKRNAGGRGLDISKVNSLDSLKDNLLQKLAAAEKHMSAF